MEEKLSNLKLHLEEIHSGIYILQKAVQNESDNLENSDIDNYLEIILEKLYTLLKEFDNTMLEIKN